MLFDPGKPRNGPSGAGARPVFRPVCDAAGGCAIIRAAITHASRYTFGRVRSETPRRRLPSARRGHSKGHGLARPRSATRGLLGRDARVELLHGSGVAARDALPRHPASARTGPGRHAAQRPAFGRLLGDLLRSAERRHQQHGRVLRGATLRWDEPGFAAARERATLDPRARRPIASTRVHEVLARAARRVAVERDAELAARGDREPALVSVQHLQFRELGAHDAAAARRAVRAPRRAAAACRPAPRRAVSRRPRQDELPTAAARLVALLAAVVPALRPRPTHLSKDRLHAGPRDRDQRVPRLDRAPPRRGRRVGRDSTAVDLQPDGSQRRGLRARSSRDGEGARGARLALRVRARRNATHPGERVAGLGHAADAARDAGLRSRVHAGHAAGARLGARERSPLPRRLGEEGAKASSRAAGRSSAPISTIPTSTTQPSR